MELSFRTIKLWSVKIIKDNTQHLLWVFNNACIKYVWREAQLIVELLSFAEHRLFCGSPVMEQMQTLKGFGFVGQSWRGNLFPSCGSAAGLLHCAIAASKSHWKTELQKKGCVMQRSSKLRCSVISNCSSAWTVWHSWQTGSQFYLLT